jgi:hypothetical protein
MKINESPTSKLAIEIEGRKFYTFEDPLEFSMERHIAMAKLYRCYEELMTPNQLETFLQTLKSTIFDGMANAKKTEHIADTFSKMHRLLEDFQFRRANLTHPEILWQIMAVTYIEEDENPDFVSEEKLNEKIAFWQSKCKDNKDVAVFFCTGGIKNHLPFTNINAESMELLLKNTEEANQKLKTLFPKI